MKNILLLAVMFSLLMGSSIVHADYNPMYAKACVGACDDSEKSWNPTGYAYSSGGPAVRWTFGTDLPRFYVDRMEVRSKCTNCELVADGDELYGWYDPIEGHYRNSEDSQGLYWTSGDDHFYWIMEDQDIDDLIYPTGSWIAFWRWGLPNLEGSDPDANLWTFRYHP